ncbi:hypothetical protein TWF696_007769 [Orbilia brochopaga]|uniref:Flavin reductase like domain-containing protein n=1 Tax=Orbilia brochopaga TaxID=3140254 RepID=A0AAV9UMA5_9PEZI
MTKTVDPDWKPGSGANDNSGKNIKKVEIDPDAPDRSPRDNYKLMISAIAPRFIGFISTVSKDGRTTNLAPFSYTTMVNSDPPIMVVGIASGLENKKDTLQNILDTGELVINVISEWFLEAANYTSIDAPHGTSEFALSGLTPLPSSKVKPPHVAESAFSIEAILVSHHPWFSPRTGKNTAVTIFAQGVNFHVREDMWVPGNEGSLVDIAKLKPVSRLGGIMYGRTTGGCEIPRAEFAVEKEKEEVRKILDEGEIDYPTKWT